MKDRSLAGQVALVTGGASGIGEACVRAFADRGASVVVVDRNVELGSRVVESLAREGTAARFLNVDVADPGAVERMVADAVAAFGRLDMAVNNAGIGGKLAPTGDYAPADWRRVIDINLSGVFYCMRYEIPQMVGQGRGAIVNMTSILGSVGFANAPAYVATKHALVGLTKSAALEYGARGIRVNCIGPAFIKTPMVLDSMDQEAQVQLAALHALGRMGEPEEVAGLTVFLCSEQASFMTGGYYLVDGGYTAR
jgi:NAD(P)-dependent dehydrogenase (short-subunit alcohol dehydrogenase family)